MENEIQNDKRRKLLIYFLRNPHDPEYSDIEPDDETDKEFSDEGSSIDSSNPQPSADKGTHISQRIVLMSKNMDDQINTNHSKERERGEGLVW
ncbi:hypothetical protein TNIN_405261 [Trichonephila inaurata madagascariensis]|uniref:Uncharacterized protein n=1 Tax=Trichonephila inaurata madagascariensis TaxID=2747483 RepID=A0A8X6XID1_9ARAC|nr:hypothetical protein TNIN_405261 [Trichonephila inaurata madagascariensis]